MKLSVEDNGKRSFVCLPCTGHCAKLPYTPGLISAVDLLRSIVAVMWTSALSTEEDSDTDRASFLLKVSHWQELDLPVPLPCPQMEEYPRGPGQLWGGSQSGQEEGEMRTWKRAVCQVVMAQFAGRSLASSAKLLRRKNKIRVARSLSFSEWEPAENPASQTCI